MTFDLEKFTLTEQHIKLLRRMCVTWDRGEFGGPAINCKRPYGNSHVISDIAEILGMPTDDDGDVDTDTAHRLYTLHLETKTALQIILEAGTFEPGLYEREKYVGTWKRSNG